jgi:hypothetical protein
MRSPAEVRAKQRQRLADILYRFVEAVEPESDVSFVKNVYQRFCASRKDALIDPNE